MRDFRTVSLHHLQVTQPWTIPYSAGIDKATADGTIPHALSSHAVLHAMKSVGKLAAIHEALDHSRDIGEPGLSERITDGQRADIRNMSADLVTVAMRLANLHGFELAGAVVERSEEKNRVTLPAWPDYIPSTPETRTTRMAT